MHKLFSLSYHRILARLAIEELNPSTIAEALAKNNIPTSGEAFLYRLPREELKHVVNIPCPINSLEDSNSQRIIASSKMLRHHCKYQQEKICGKCPFKANCPSAKQPFGGQMKYTPQNLLTFWSALQKFNKPEDIYFRQWISAYKLGDSIIASLNDLSEGGKQLQEYDRLRVQAAQKYQQKTKEQKEKPLDMNQVHNQLSERFKLQDKFLKNQQKREQEKTTTTSSTQPQQEEVLGRDFSFDQQTEFQPVSKFTKENYAEKKPPRTLKAQKGYQSIESEPENFSKRPADKFPKTKYVHQEDEQQSFYKKSNKFHQNQDQRQKQDRRFEGKQDHFENKYDRRQERNFEGKGNFENKYDRKQERRFEGKQGNYEKKYEKNYEKKYDRKEQRNFEGKQGNYENKYDRKHDQNMSSHKSYKQSRKYENVYYEQEPTSYQDKRNKQAEEYSRKQYKPKNTPENPFVSKWNQKEEKQDRKSKEQFNPKREGSFKQDNFEPKQQAERPPKTQKSQRPAPKIIEMEEINEEEVRSRPGRVVRRRSTRSQTTVDE